MTNNSDGQSRPCEKDTPSAKTRVVFVVNPISGSSDKTYVLRLIEERLDRGRYEYEVVRTKASGHAAIIAREAARGGAGVVCAVGGDGTVNEVACGLIRTQTALAIIPTGSGNGLARHLRIPTDPLNAISVINRGLVTDMDYGVVNGHPFFCTCGVGFDAFVSQRFANSGKRGPASYLESVLLGGLQYHPEVYDIEFPDNQDGAEMRQAHKAFLISFANASQYGNNAYIAPSASVRDGVLDVTVIEPFTAIEAPIIATQLFSGTIRQNSRIKTFRCQKAVIQCAMPVVVHYDGEPLQTNGRIEVELVPGGLRCLSLPAEGVPDMEERVQNFIEEQFHHIFAKTEMMIQENILKSQRIKRINSDIIRKLTRK